MLHIPKNLIQNEGVYDGIFITSHYKRDPSPQPSARTADFLAMVFMSDGPETYRYIILIWERTERLNTNTSATLGQNVLAHRAVPIHDRKTRTGSFEHNRLRKHEKIVSQFMKYAVCRAC
jgi:hypothetical protein